MCHCVVGGTLIKYSDSVCIPVPAYVHITCVYVCTYVLCVCICLLCVCICLLVVSDNWQVVCVSIYT